MTRGAILTTSPTRRWSAARAALAFATSLAASVGCSSNTVGTDAAPIDGPAPDTGSDTAHADGGDDARLACNALTLTGVAPANRRGSGASAPTPSGGTVADGTYWLSEAIYYGQPGLAPFPLMRAKVVIAGTTMQTIEGDPEPGGVNPDRTFTDAISVRATTVVITPVCPSTSAAPLTVGFTVVAGGAGADAAGRATLTLLVDDAAGTTGLVYTQQ